MSRDDLFDDDPPEEKSAPEKPDVAEDADEEFFFEITDDDSGTDESPAEQPVAGEPLVDEPMVEEPSLEMRKTTGGSSQRILMLLLLLVVLIAAGYFFMGDLLLPPAPEPAITVKTSQPQKMKIPQRKQVEQEQQAVKEVVMPAERVAEENTPVPPEKAVSDATVAGSSPVDNTEPLAAATEASGQQEEERDVAAGSAEPAEVAQAEPVAETSEPIAEKSEPVAETSETIAEKSEPIAGEAPAVAVSTSEEPPAPVAPAASDYVLQVGAFVVDSNLEITLDKVKKLGFDPVVLERRKSTTMTRLRVGAYPEPVAREKLQELQQLIASAFLLHEEQQMVLYAGSYYNVNRARSMADKLFQHDIRIEEEPVEIQVPMKIVRFGKFHDSAAASVVAGQAKKSGLDVLVVKRN